MMNDYLNMIMDIEKDISNSYSNFLNEASNDYLYENIFSLMEDSKDMAREIYNYLYDNGQITVKEIDNSILLNNIDELVNKLES